jgi:exosome complex component RRP4
MTDNLLVKDKDVVVPGQTMAQGMAFIPSLGTFREGDDIVAGRIGLVSVEGNVLKIVPLAGPYLPKLGDVVVGYVEDVLLSGWRLNLACAYSAVLGLKDATADFIPRGVDLTQYFALGDIVFGKLINVTSQRLIDVTLRGQGLRKLSPGKLVTVSSVKVPRIIGKDGTMIQAVMELTRTEIIVGQNGLVWIKGDPAMEVVAADAVKFIEANAHKAGLTQTARKFIEDKLGGGR